MQSDYTFLTDHSYSLRMDNEKISLKLKGKKQQQQPRRQVYKNKSSKRTVSVDRSSSDKENQNQRKKKSTPTKVVIKKKSHPKEVMDGIPSLSIEERVKLRRTKPLPMSTKTPLKRILARPKVPIKSKKFFLGSGLDLDNIVLGNRRRRSVQT